MSERFTIIEHAHQVFDGNVLEFTVEVDDKRTGYAIEMSVAYAMADESVSAWPLFTRDTDGSEYEITAAGRNDAHDCKRWCELRGGEVEKLCELILREHREAMSWAV